MNLRAHLKIKKKYRSNGENWSFMCESMYEFVCRKIAWVFFEKGITEWTWCNQSQLSYNGWVTGGVINMGTKNETSKLYLWILNLSVRLCIFLTWYKPLIRKSMNNVWSQVLPTTDSLVFIDGWLKFKFFYGNPTDYRQFVFGSLNFKSKDLHFLNIQMLWYTLKRWGTKTC